MMNEHNNDHRNPIRLYSRRDSRCLAFHLLYAIDRMDYDVVLDIVVKDFKNEFNLEVDEHSFAINLARGVLSNLEPLDLLITKHVKNWEIERLGCCTRLILRLAIWELNQDDAIPSVVINEAVELAKSFAEKDAYKFVNGVLDAVSKNAQNKKILIKKRLHDKQE